MNMQIGHTFKHAKFGKNAAFIESRNGQPLDLTEIAAACPSVFANEAHHSRSKRYAYISTLEILEGLAKEGFRPFSIMQGGSKYEDKLGFTKHLIRLRSASPVKTVRGSTYEICLLNSHDGTTSEKMYGGFFRWACSNGSIFFDGEATEVKVPHSGHVVDRVIEGAYTVLSQAQLAGEHVENFQRLQINSDEAMAFATAAAQLRFEEESPVKPQQLLIPRRQEDFGDDLWTVFNRVQENTIRGGLDYVHTSSEGRQTHRQTRPVRSVDGDVKLNRALWTLAEEMARLKTRPEI